MAGWKGKAAGGGMGLMGAAQGCDGGSIKRNLQASMRCCECLLCFCCQCTPLCKSGLHRKCTLTRQLGSYFMDIYYCSDFFLPLREISQEIM